jgi:gamma-glutamylcyclotransferase (GGCT)/AIG2-like uncharacterized protein YtfP
VSKQAGLQRCQQVFVYGSLRQGQRYHHLIQGARHIGDCRLPAHYTLFDLGPYPALRPDGHDPVLGEVYLVDESMLRRLDVLERHPLEFRRRLTATPAGAAWIYLYTRSPAPATPVVGHGDWSRYLSEQGRERAGRTASRVHHRR